MTKSMNNEESTFEEGKFVESRRTFLKGTAYSVAGATLAAGVFKTVADTPAAAEDGKFTATPETLSFYPPFAEWDSFTELDGDDWKRGGTERNGVQSETNPDGIKAIEYMLVPTACSNCEASCGLTAWVDLSTYKAGGQLAVRKYMGKQLHSGSRGRN
jgi:anaerobic selenocysteine-containing dehydrogenase